MALLKVVVYPNPVLSQKAAKLDDFGPEMQKVFDDMIETMYEEDGVGLAAPQIGLSKQIFIAAPTAKKGEEYVVVNPRIEDPQGREVDVEGCLSFPGISARVARAKRLLLHYQDRNGKAQNLEAKDFFARVIQHEMDHLNGVLLIDRVDFAKRHELLAEYENAKHRS